VKDRPGAASARNFLDSAKKPGSGDIALPGFLESAVLGQIQQVEAGVRHRKEVSILQKRNNKMYAYNNKQKSSALHKTGEF
jgi:hypothetical protein